MPGFDKFKALFKQAQDSELRFSALFKVQHQLSCCRTVTITVNTHLCLTSADYYSCQAVAMHCAGPSGQRPHQPGELQTVCSTGSHDQASDDVVTETGCSKRRRRQGAHHTATQCLAL